MTQSTFRLHLSYTIPFSMSTNPTYLQYEFCTKNWITPHGFAVFCHILSNHPILDYHVLHGVNGQVNDALGVVTLLVG